ncbi:MAG: signal peptidase I [Sediminicola sp.]|jgi:signal peptidase I|tara:strand:+ start:3555 stop:4013 length:459 start_codon:yes stop_codon:yes gene_type:complete
MKTHEFFITAQKLQLLNAPKTDVMFHGLSMEPILCEGDRVVSEEVKFKDIRVGDIITSYFEDKYPTRRVVFKNKKYLTVWCENRPNRGIVDVQPHEVLGRVIARKRGEQLLTNTDAEWLELANNALQKYQALSKKRAYKRIKHFIIRKLNLD